MTDFPFLLVLLLLPLIAGLGLLAVPKHRHDLIRRITLGVSLLVLVLTVLMTVAFEPSGPRFQFVQSYEWIPDFGVSFSLGVDGIALVMILLIGVLVPAVIGASWNEGTDAGEKTGKTGSMRTFFAWLLVLEALLIGVFAATDIFLFYVFFEAMLVPMYFLIGSFGGPRRQYAAVK
ncbi:MAG: NADH-quinone oxidoreductase subunit M, partial [Geodermatophilaceae bacterium]|nr:NADH-quinone oxidoreductase subunit M [Geodermatophilaceae bacterium]